MQPSTKMCKNGGLATQYKYYHLGNTWYMWALPHWARCGVPNPPIGPKTGYPTSPWAKPTGNSKPGKVHKSSTLAIGTHTHWRRRHGYHIGTTWRAKLWAKG